MEIPPGWLGLQLVVADTDGCVSEHEHELFYHFCSQKCLVAYTAGDNVRRRLCMADKKDVEESGEQELQS